MKELTTEQMLAAELYMTRKSNGLSVEDVAVQIGVSRRTIYRWLEMPEFKRYCREKAVQVAEESLGRVLDALTLKALEAKNAKFVELYLKVCGVLNGEMVRVDVNAATDDDARSNQAIESEIEELKRQLGLTDQH